MYSKNVKTQFSTLMMRFVIIIRKHKHIIGRELVDDHSGPPFVPKVFVDNDHYHTMFVPLSHYPKKTQQLHHLYFSAFHLFQNYGKEW